MSPALFGEKGYWGGGERYALELARAMSSVVPTRLVSFAPQSERFSVGELRVELLRVRHRYRGSQFNAVSEALFNSLAGAKLVHVHQYECAVTVQAVAIAHDYSGYPLRH